MFTAVWMIIVSQWYVSSTKRSPFSSTKRYLHDLFIKLRIFYHTLVSINVGKSSTETNAWTKDNFSDNVRAKKHHCQPALFYRSYLPPACKKEQSAAQLRFQSVNLREIFLTLSKVFFEMLIEFFRYFKFWCKANRMLVAKRMPRETVKSRVFLRLLGRSSKDSGGNNT